MFDRRSLRGFLALVLLLASALAAGFAPEPTRAAPVGRVRPGEVLVEMRPGASAAALARRSGAALATRSTQSIRRLLVPRGQEQARAEALRGDPDVIAAAPNYVRSASDLTPDDPRYPEQWWLAKIHAPAAWDITTGSSSVTIAILDSGAELTHPDLQPNLVAGTNTLDVDPGSVGSGCIVADESDDYGHGTHVAGIAAALGNNGLGVAGVAWHVKIQPVKVLDCTGNGSDAQIIAGIDWARQHGARVLNMSFGGEGQSDVLDAAVLRAWQTGLVITVAAGNSFTSIPFYPAASPGALSVGATTSTDAQAGFSNYGSTLGIVAPGDTILSTVRGSGYGYKTGTSMASPVVAGAAALVFSYHPEFSNSRVVGALEVSADKVGPIAYDANGRNNTFGHGRLNLARALQTVGITMPLIPRSGGLGS